MMLILDNYIEFGDSYPNTACIVGMLFYAWAYATTHDETYYGVLNK